MQDLGVIAMVTALLWPIVGGALVGLIGGIAKRDGLFGTLIDIVLGAAFGYGLVLAFIRLSSGLSIPDTIGTALMLGLPVVGGLIGLWVKSFFKSA